MKTPMMIIDQFEHHQSIYRLLSSIKHTLLVVNLIFIMILVISIITSFVLHGLNPIMLLLTIFDLNSVIQLSKTLNNPTTSSSTNYPISRDNTTTTVIHTEIAYLIINRPSGEFIFTALILYITAIFNQLIAIISIIRQHLCLLVFTLITNLLIFAISIIFVKTNLFLLLMLIILLTIFYTTMLKQIKNRYGSIDNHHHHHQNHYSAINHNSHHNQQRLSPPSMNQQQNYSGGINPVDSSPIYQSQNHHTQTPIITTTTPTNNNDPKILAPIIYCPHNHYSESVC
ncbi:uncharacterized protein LOC142645723 [Dermatophagoides pteronyssinus]|uniref:uncharacterized protein LOC142645723 n=1 Tax=Dermatophagoides pteronyssinus TaxID=6956 RepID=UPI003F676E73